MMMIIGSSDCIFWDADDANDTDNVDNANGFDNFDNDNFKSQHAKIVTRLSSRSCFFQLDVENDSKKE